MEVEPQQLTRCQDSRRELLNKAFVLIVETINTSSLVLKVNLNVTNANPVSEVLLNIQALGLLGFIIKISWMRVNARRTVALSINKKTAFDWRHKVLASLTENDKDDFTGITESDETFFLNSEKGRFVSHRKSRKIKNQRHQ